MVSNDDMVVSSKRFYRINESDTVNVLAGNSLVTTFTPPVGFSWKLNSMTLKAPAVSGATSGTHQITVMNGIIPLIRGVSVYSTGIQFDLSHWILADSSQSPSSPEATLLAIYNPEYVWETQLKIQYYNNTNVATNELRLYRFNITESSIIKE